MDIIEVDEVARHMDFIKLIELIVTRQKAGWKLAQVVKHTTSDQRDSYVSSVTLIWQKERPSYSSNYRD